MTNTTKEQTDIILKVARRLCHKYTFAYYDEDDIVQEAFIIALEALPKYNPEIASLESFLYSHLNNRLQNFKRDNYFRANYICQYCNNEDLDCNYCFRRNKLNNAKRFLMSPINIDIIKDENEPNTSCSYDTFTDMEIEEIKDRINQQLNISLRADYLRMIDGVRISKSRKEKVEEEVLNIIDGYLDG